MKSDQYNSTWLLEEVWFKWWLKGFKLAMNSEIIFQGSEINDENNHFASAPLPESYFFETNQEDEIYFPNDGVNIKEGDYKFDLT